MASQFGRSRSTVSGRPAITVATTGFPAAFRAASSSLWDPFMLKGGRPAVGLAMMRAANKVSGWIRHYVHLPLGADVPTPFPEIVRSR